MTKGIAVQQMEDGELIYLNLPMHPGSKADKTAPSSPQAVAKRVGTNMGYIGVELSWMPASDDNWVSYYEILRNGKVIDKVAKGTYYFDHSAGADPAAQYDVQAVCGSGDISAKAAAAGAGGMQSLVTDDTGGELRYTGNGWKHEQNVWAVYNGTQSSTRQAKDAMEYSFRGNRITWDGRLGSTMGKADVYVDGKLGQTVDTVDADETPKRPS